MNLAIVPAAASPAPEAAERAQSHKGMDPLAMLQDPELLVESFGSLLQKHAWVENESTGQLLLKDLPTEEAFEGLESQETLEWSHIHLAVQEVPTQEPQPTAFLGLDKEPTQEAPLAEETQEAAEMKRERRSPQGDSVLPQQVQTPLQVQPTAVPQTQQLRARSPHKEPKSTTPQPEKALNEAPQAAVARLVAHPAPMQETPVHEASLFQAQGFQQGKPTPVFELTTQAPAHGLLDEHPELDPILLTQSTSLFQEEGLETAHRAHLQPLSNSQAPELEGLGRPAFSSPMEAQQRLAAAQRSYPRSATAPHDQELPLEIELKPSTLPPRKGSVLSPQRLNLNATPKGAGSAMFQQERPLPQEASTSSSSAVGLSGDTQKRSSFGSSGQDAQQQLPQQQPGALNLSTQQSEAPKSFQQQAQTGQPEGAPALVQQQLIPAIVDHLKRLEASSMSWTRIELPRNAPSGSGSLGVSVRVRNNTIEVLFDAQTQPWSQDVSQNWDVLQAQAREKQLILKDPKFVG